jgi:hypothetical protein
MNECIFFTVHYAKILFKPGRFFTMQISPLHIANVGMWGWGWGVAEVKIYLFSPSRMVDGQGKFMY